MSEHAAFQSSSADVEQPLGAVNRLQPSTKFLTVAQVCDRLEISRWTWRRWVRSGIAPAPVPCGRQLRWRVVDIDRFERGGRKFFGSHTRQSR